MYDGRTITLHPSIGNWGFPCRSHYWIRGNRVEWAPSWSEAEIKAGKMHDRLAKEQYFNSFKEPTKPEAAKSAVPTAAHAQPATSEIWQKLVDWWKG